MNLIQHYIFAINRNRKIIKTMLWLVCVVANVAIVRGQALPMKMGTGPSKIDTMEISRLIFRATPRDSSVAYAYREAAGCLFRNLQSQLNPLDKEFTGLWLDLSIFYAWSGNIAKSRNAYVNYISSAVGQPDSPLLKANRLLYQSLYLSAAGSDNQAADSLVASITIRPASGTLNRLLLADSYGALARFYKKTGDMFSSSRNFERSINFNRELGRIAVLAEDLSDLSSVLSSINISDPRAESVLFESFDIYTKVKLPGKDAKVNSILAKAQVLNELGVLYSRRGNIRESLKYFKQSLNEKSQTPQIKPQEFVVVLSNIGHCYQYLNDSDSARFYFLKAIDYALRSTDRKSPQYPRRLAQVYVNLGANYGKEEKPTQAIEYFQRALNRLDSTCSITNLSTNPRITEVTPLLAEFTAYKAHAYHKRYNQLHKAEDLRFGLKTFMVALEMMDTLRFLYSFESKPYLSSGAKIHYFHALDMALDLYEITGEKRYLEQAFQLSDRNKSATLSEFLRTNQARKYMGNVAPWIIVEDSLKQLINQIESRLANISFERDIQADSIALMLARLSVLTDKLKNVGVVAKKENPKFFQTAYLSRGFLPEDIQNMINPGEALIDYTVIRDEMLLKDFMVAFVVTRDTFYSYRNSLPDHFRDTIQKFRATITSYVDSRVFHEFSRLSHMMYENFVAPVEKFKGINQLIILPDDELGFLPFEVFISDTLKPGNSDFRKLSYLNKKYQISYISSHEQLYQFRKHPGQRAKSTIYTFAPFAMQGIRMDTLDLFALGNSGQEAQYIARYFKSKVFENEKAGEQTLRHAFQEESVINLSTHGIMDKNHPMKSRILLNPAEPDGSLYLFEIMSLKIRSSLVILNACNTGTGQLQVGEGIMSIARGFEYADVPSVITTMWPIDDQSSAAVMKYFFKNIYDGMDQRAALMKARNTYIEHANKATGAPYFWAGQILIGDPGTLSIQHRTNSTGIISILIVIGLIFTLILVFHKKVKH